MLWYFGSCAGRGKGGEVLQSCDEPGDVGNFMVDALGDREGGEANAQSILEGDALGVFKVDTLGDVEVDALGVFGGDVLGVLGETRLAF